VSDTWERRGRKRIWLKKKLFGWHHLLDTFTIHLYCVIVMHKGRNHFFNSEKNAKYCTVRVFLYEFLDPCAVYLCWTLVAIWLFCVGLQNVRMFRASSTSFYANWYLRELKDWLKIQFNFGSRVQCTNLRTDWALLIAETNKLWKCLFNFAISNQVNCLITEKILIKM
jgi:hypothetical protein